MALQVSGGIIDGRHGQVNLSVHVVQHGFDDSLASDEEQVLSVGAPGTRSTIQKISRWRD